MTDLVSQVTATLRRSPDNPTGWTDDTFAASTGEAVAVEHIVETVLRVAAPMIRHQILTGTAGYIRANADNPSVAAVADTIDEIAANHGGRVLDRLNRGGNT